MCNVDYMLHFFPNFLHLSGVFDSYSAGKLAFNGCIYATMHECVTIIKFLAIFVLVCNYLTKHANFQIHHFN